MILAGLIKALSRASTYSSALDRAERSTDFSVVDGLRVPLLAGLLARRAGPQAMLVVTATGLNLKPFGGIELSVDGGGVKVGETMAYKALMLSGVPNFAFTIGYTNASWTLKADLVAEYVCRLLDHLDERGLRTVVAPADDEVGEAPFMDFSSGYVVRSLDLLPRQGDREPWRLRQNYLHDLRTIRRGEVDDGVLAFA